MLDVSESRIGRSLKRRPLSEYAITAKTLTASTATLAADPTATR
ncbi:hypothetical protein BC477_06295 [Clavibacter michiganensis subsp. michiganensis]|uniref:Uncharacterized protein n=1 Tax=Clavibacter michiganensis subsp. michiganensis TaxID=33013 RepID=A0A251XLG9_CLAMM|nr:hypothetical protein BC477_06295 [Clavibacter michiganensis subsp. michiganensis]OUE04327.1 hypothetical protein CMMCAS07_05225 [Clavibacter michiganensis subsp. michiganensis]